VQALAERCLHIKPLIRVEREDGKYSTFGKSGPIPQALELLTDHMAKEYGETRGLGFGDARQIHEQARSAQEADRKPPECRQC